MGDDDLNVVEIRKELQRRLSAESDEDVKELSREFGGLNSNHSQVDFVLKLLRKFQLVPKFAPNIEKNDKLAVQFREKGNEYFKLKNGKKAWELYTLSAGASPTTSLNLGIAYANRSAVLFENNLQDECQLDIKSALQNNYPEHLRPKLLVRQKNSKNLESNPWTFHDELPTLPSRNPKIQSASNSLEIDYSAIDGRHIIATKDLEAGEILAIESPYASLLVPGVTGHCSQCLQLNYNLIPCDSCTETFFCDEICKEEALEAYHKYECELLTTLRKLEFCKLALLPLRIALMTRESDLDFNENDYYHHSDRYKEIHELVTNREKRSISDVFERATSAAILFDLISNHTTFFEDYNRSEVFFKNILMHHLMTAPSNFHEISELTENTENNNFEPMEIGAAAFSFLSLLNHSCSPNVTRHCYGRNVVLRSIQNIKKGQQIYDNYGYHYALVSKNERKKDLKSQYYFDCSCEACENNWGCYQKLPNIDEAPTIDSETISKLTRADSIVAKSILNEILAKLKECEQWIPCQNFCQLQEVVKQCFATFGNVRRNM